jgi:hypothetical protein
VSYRIHAIQPEAAQRHLLPIAEVIRLLGKKHSLAAKDVKHYLDFTRSISFDTQLAKDIVTASKFRHWYTSAESQMLFIVLNVASTSIRPGSFVTAMLYQALLGLQPATVLVYFCSQNILQETTDPLADMMAQVISQLLGTREVDLEEWSRLLSPRQHHDALKSQNLEYLLSFFKYLMARGLEWGAIFLLVDDFWRLEESVQPGLLEQVLDYLSDVVQKCSAGDKVILKIVFMTPSRHSAALEGVRDEDKLRITPRPPTANRSVDVRAVALALRQASLISGADGETAGDAAG